MFLEYIKKNDMFKIPPGLFDVIELHFYPLLIFFAPLTGLTFGKTECKSMYVGMISGSFAYVNCKFSQ